MNEDDHTEILRTMSKNLQLCGIKKEDPIGKLLPSPYNNNPNITLTSAQVKEFNLMMTQTGCYLASLCGCKFENLNLLKMMQFDCKFRELKRIRNDRS